MVYATSEIAQFHNHRHGYLATAWLVFVIPTALTVALLLSPHPTALKQWRNRWSDRKLCRSFKTFVIATRQLINLNSKEVCSYHQHLQCISLPCYRRCIPLYRRRSSVPDRNGRRALTISRKQPKHSVRNPDVDRPLSYLPIPSFAFIFWDEGAQNDQKNNVRPADTSQLKGDPDYCFN